MIGSKQKIIIVIIFILTLYNTYRMIDKDCARSINSRYNIFLIETNDSKTFIDYRQLCSIESAAKHNPNAIVHVKSLKAMIKDNLLIQYPNIQFELIDINDALKDTPIADWWSKNRLSADPYYRISHTSDALRYAFLYKKGGFYSDLDTITLKSIEPLLKYNAGFPFEESGHYRLTGSFFVAQKKHPFIYYLMEKYCSDYDPSDWMTVGPNLIRKYLYLYCNVANNTDLLVGENKRSQCDVVTFPYTYHTPIVSWKVKSLFFKNRTMTADELANSYQIHFATKNTGKFKLNWNSSSFYELLASWNCPLVYEMASMENKENNEKY